MAKRVENTLILPAAECIPEQPGDKKHWGNASGLAARALAIAELAQSDVPQTPVLCVVTDQTQTALQLQEAIEFFLGPESQIPVKHFPDWEILPYDIFSPHQDIISQRLALLAQLPNWSLGVVLVTIPTLMHRLAPKAFVDGQRLVITRGDELNLERKRADLQTAGYTCVDTVYEHGEFAVRGSILDLFPMGSIRPYRIDLFDNEIDTIRTFDPETQRSDDKLERIEILPAKEFPLNKPGVQQFIEQWHAHFDVDTRACPLFQDVSQGMNSAGLEYYLPLFFRETTSLCDYLPEHTLLVNLGSLDVKASQFWQDTYARYDERRHDPTHPLLSPEKVLFRPDELHARLNRFAQLVLHADPLETRPGRCNLALVEGAQLSVDDKSKQPLHAVKAYVHHQLEHHRRILVTAESPGRRESLIEWLQSAELRARVFDHWQDYLRARVHKKNDLGICVSPLTDGFELPEHSLVVITEAQLLGKQVTQSRRRRRTQDFDQDAVVRNLTELKPGAPLVHIDHGVGRFVSLQTLEIDGQAQEFVVMVYASDAKLYVPVASLHLIARYAGVDPDLAPLHKLGSDQWQKEKRKAAKKAHDAAAELLDIYARRAAQTGFSYCINTQEYRQFEAEFPFEETPDQTDAITAVIADMQSKQPMDRLVCGDVGFGKTEVAMRATFIATHAGKQVSVLVPTTLLAQQHYDSFRDRFANWPVRVEVLSRFKTAQEQTKILKDLADGKVDILIGTHKLLQKSVVYQNLGLIIVDEEHRFGVRHKEALKKIRANVDVLTLTATPIPRTLNMAMSGLRDISMITTAPAKRLSVKTFVRQHQTALVKEAVMRELLRGGQVYYLHNEVNSIERTADELKQLIPEARIGIAHGQLRESELERVMSDFYHQRYNVLVCTTIIETGIDVPSANTIIMDRADKLGLAQLHQLRGRVGRSHHQAYAYLLTPHPKSMTADAVKRLDAITEASTLGAGFMLASHDLEIRGSGELLGDEQSGHVQSVGFTLYMDMLNQAVDCIKRGEVPNIEQPIAVGTQVNCHTPALIPDAYLPDVNLRLVLYKRIANAKDNHALDELKAEMIDRFGLLPEATQTLFRTTRIRLLAQKLGIESIDVGAQGGRLEFNAKPNVDPVRIIQLVQSQPGTYRLEGADKLRIHETLHTPEERLSWVEKLVKHLAQAA